MKKIWRLIALLLLFLAALPSAAPQLHPLPLTTPKTQPSDLSSLSQPAQASISAALGKDDNRYHFTPTAGGWAALSRTTGVDTSLTATGLTVHAGQAGFSLVLAGFGAATPQPVAGASPLAADNRIEYRRGSLTEWYTNGPLGLEQGFTIPASPAAVGDGITLDLRLASSLAPSLDAGGRGLTLLGAGGQAVLQYGGLTAYDASGKDLPASMEWTAGSSRLLIKVDDRAAVYPVTIDPWVQRARLANSGEEGGDFLGTAMALSGDTLVASAPDLLGYGPVYVFQRAPGNPANPFLQVAKLNASNGAHQLFYGTFLAISGDTILVSAYNAGAVYVYVKPLTGWADMTETALLTTAASSYHFGFSVAISGDTVVSGAPGRGQAFVFVKPVTGWSGTLTETAQLVPSDGVASDNFGTGAAISGSTIVIGAPQKDNGKGRAYVYVRPGNGWSGVLSETSQLSASDGAAFDYFGNGVAIDRGTVVVGSYGKDAFTGKAYVYLQPGGGWTTGTATENARLVASDAASNYEFSRQVSISGDTVVVGANGALSHPGKAYIYLKPAAGWSNQIPENASLSASDGGTADWLGFTVATDGATVIASAPRIHNNQGALYTFLQPISGWSGAHTESAQVVSSHGASFDNFGYSVAIRGDTVLVGAYGSNNDQGEAYLFTKPAPGWYGPLTQSARLLAIDAHAGEFFGLSVALDGDTAVVGAPAAAVGIFPNQGQVYVFNRPPSGWTGTIYSNATLTEQSGNAFDSFGAAVAVSGTTILVGAPDAHPTGNTLQGAAYLFLRPGATWSGHLFPAANLFATDNAANHFFGSSVAIYNDTALIGATGVSSSRGAAYIYLKPLAGWSGDVSQAAKLIDSSGSANYQFGEAVAMNADTAFVGEQNPTAAHARVSVFPMPVGGWTGTLDASIRLTPHDGTVGDRFGRALAVDGDTLVVGAPDAIHGTTDQGAVYVFVKPPTGWATATETVRLIANDGAAGDTLGTAVAVSGGVVVGSAPMTAVGSHPQQGAVYVFDVPFKNFLPTIVKP